MECENPNASPNDSLSQSLLRGEGSHKRAFCAPESPYAGNVDVAWSCLTLGYVIIFPLTPLPKFKPLPYSLFCWELSTDNAGDVKVHPEGARDNTTPLWTPGATSASTSHLSLSNSQEMAQINSLVGSRSLSLSPPPVQSFIKPPLQPAVTWVSWLLWKREKSLQALCWVVQHAQPKSVSSSIWLPLRTAICAP